MHNQADVIVELWDKMKDYIPAKERLNAADDMLTVFDDFGLADGIDDLAGELDKPLQTAVVSKYALDDALEEDDEDDYGF